MSPKLPASVSGFTPIPLTYSSSATHVLYARRNVGSKKNKPDVKGKGPAYPEGRTLFLVNVPPDATEREISLLFKSAGTVERVVFDGDREEVEEELEESDADEDMDSEVDGVDEDEEDTQEQPRKKRKILKEEKQAPPQVVPLPPRPDRAYRRTGGSAHVVFLDPSSLSRALTAPSKPKPWPVDTTSPQGFAHYENLYAALRPPLDVVRAHADSWMELFEYEQEKKKQKSKYKKGEAIVDEEGFTLVTRGGAYGQTLGGGVGVASKKFQGEVREGGGKRNRKNRKEPKEKETFYAFQIHEKKRKELISLKQKWEEDKANVEKLKSSRKFKPY
ncbi:unnamed protein product [Somion occarium]|uniref:Ribosomal RNA-processing protein 7 n=1 Tax=Somion occarium TaxID=3059160 RepID=A0ABP1CWN6_9APHY